MIAVIREQRIWNDLHSTIVQDDTNKKLYFVMTNKGKWRIYQDNKPVLAGSTPANFTINADTDYSLWLVRLPNQTQLWFNATPIAILQRASPYSGGRTGVVGISGSADLSTPITVIADDFLVRTK